MPAVSTAATATPDIATTKAGVDKVGISGFAAATTAGFDAVRAELDASRAELETATAELMVAKTDAVAAAAAATAELQVVQVAAATAHDAVASELKTANANFLTASAANTELEAAKVEMTAAHETEAHLATRALSTVRAEVETLSARVQMLDGAAEERDEQGRKLKEMAVQMASAKQELDTAMVAEIIAKDALRASVPGDQFEAQQAALKTALDETDRLRDASGRLTAFRKDAERQLTVVTARKEVRTGEAPTSFLTALPRFPSRGRRTP